MMKILQVKLKLDIDIGCGRLETDDFSVDVTFKPPQRRWMGQAP